jgi:hypothetical protein
MHIRPEPLSGLTTASSKAAQFPFSASFNYAPDLKKHFTKIVIYVIRKIEAFVFAIEIFDHTHAVWAAAEMVSIHRSSSGLRFSSKSAKENVNR